MRFASATEMRLALEAVMSGKRPPTARIAQQAAVASATGAIAAVPMMGNPGSGPPPANGAPRQDVRTGTVMGAPAEGALTPATPGSGPPPPHNMQRPGTGTARAAPIDLGAMQMQQPMQGYGSERPPSPDMATTPPPRGRHEPQRGGGAGLIVVLAIVALLLGAGAVVAYVMSTQSPTPVAIEPLPTVTTLTTPTTPVQPTVVTPPNLGTVAPLNPVTPQQPIPVGPKPHPSGSAAPHPSGSAAPDGGGPPPLFPPFPSTFPSAFPPFPSSLPSGFPTFQAPSGFPPLFPPSPPGPQ